MPCEYVFWEACVFHVELYVYLTGPFCMANTNKFYLCIFMSVYFDDIRMYKEPASPWETLQSPSSQCSNP